MRRIIACVLALMLLVSLGGCRRDDGTGKGFRLPIDGEPRQLDPQIATDPASVTVCATLFEGLTRLDADGKVTDGAATYTLSADRLTYTFTLRESYWSTLSVKGESTPFDKAKRVVADDFLFGIQRVASPDNQSGTAAVLYGIQNAEAVHKGEKPLAELGVKAVDSRTLTITLDAPDDTFPARLASTPFLPCNRAFFAYTAGRYGLEARYVLSNGAFSLTAWNHGDSLLLNKHGGYHAAAQVAPAAVRYVIGTEDAVAALQNGGLDIAVLPVGKTDAAKKAGLSVHTLSDSVRQISFNTAAAPLANVSVRRALRDAIEWDTIYAYLTSIGETKATGYIPLAATLDGKTYRDGANAATYSTQVAAATAALGEGLKALYPEEQAPTLPPVTLLAPNDDKSANLARYIVQSWQKNLKISCGLELVDEETLNSRIQDGAYQIALHTAIGGGLSAVDNLAAYTTGAGNNRTGFADSAFDAAYAVARRGKKSDVQTAEGYLREACPAIPLSFPKRAYGIAAGTQGITVRPFGGGTYGGAYLCMHAKKFED